MQPPWAAGAERPRLEMSKKPHLMEGNRDSKETREGTGAAQERPVRVLWRGGVSCIAGGGTEPGGEGSAHRPAVSGNSAEGGSGWGDGKHVGWGRE